MEAIITGFNFQELWNNAKESNTIQNTEIQQLSFTCNTQNKKSNYKQMGKATVIKYWPYKYVFFLIKILSSYFRGLPWWRSGWESACQCRGHGFEPWSGRIPHAAEQRGPWATITEPARLEPVRRNKRGRDSERPAHCDEEWSPLAAAGESPRTETKTQHSQK